ncbi:MAG: CHAT domain-containing protein [Candidatus Helarchaeota archaeon]|nr:CHAT domain-containing protein [Candidatus Helarchaeota archaeon]
MTQVSCSNGRITIEKGLIKKIEETWYGDLFEIEENLKFIAENGSEEPLKFENARVEPRIKTIKYHWSETDRVGIREGFAYDKTLRAHVSQEKMVDSGEISYSTKDGAKIKRIMDIFFLQKTKFSIFGMNLSWTVEAEKQKKGIFQWTLNPKTTINFLKKGIHYDSHPVKVKGSDLGDNTLWYAESHRKIANIGQLLASTTYQNNRTKIIEITIPQTENAPEKIEIRPESIEDTSLWQTQKRVHPQFQFKIDLQASGQETFRIEFRFIFIPERKMNDICFLIPDSPEFWPCALACAVTPGERREHFAVAAHYHRQLNVFNPIMWYQEGQPLDPSIYDYLLSLRELDKICLFGVPRIEDIQQLIILLLDRGSELTQLDFYIFAKPEHLKELQARKDKIAENVLMTKGGYDPEVLETIKNIIKIYPIANLTSAPLEFRRLFYQHEIISKYDRPTSEYLLVVPENPCIAAILIPLARYLQAPVLLYSETNADLAPSTDFMADFKGKNPLALIIASKKVPKVAEQVKKLGYSDYTILYTDEADLAIKTAQILETLKAFSLGFEGSLQSPSALGSPQELTLLSVLMNLDSATGKKFEKFLNQELNGEEIPALEYLRLVLDFASTHFKEFMKIYYENWSYLEEVVFNSAVLCETMAKDAETQRRCNLLMAGNYAFYKNGPLIPIQPTTTPLETRCVTALEEIDTTIGDGGNPEKVLKQLGKELHKAVIPPSIDSFLKTLLPNQLPYFSVRSGVPVELIHDDHIFWSLEYGFGRISGIDHFSTALLTNLSVSISALPKESLKILLIANPTLDLPDASKELVQLRQRLKGFEIETIEGWDAREHEVIMQINRGPNIIHYSGHGYLDPLLPLRSGLILTDSRLTALEISHLKLWSNPLIFTNACLSAALGTAFLRAGSCLFVSPLWSVTDFAALEYAYAFYSSILSGWSLGEAQKIAKNLVYYLLSRSEAFSHDFTWLAYSCIGDPAYSLVYTKPWEKQVFGEIMLATYIVKQKSVLCARNKLLKKIFKKIILEAKQFATQTKDPAFDQILPLLESTVGAVISASDADWQRAMESAVRKLEELDNLGKKINDLNIQDRVRQLFGMVFIAARV